VLRLRVPELAAPALAKAISSRLDRVDGTDAIELLGSDAISVAPVFGMESVTGAALTSFYAAKHAVDSGGERARAELDRIIATTKDEALRANATACRFLDDSQTERETLDTIR
jgi:hypothetical protein